MSFRGLRERRLLSQEKLAQMSGLSLRTIQRADAGDRVSYATLRALAVTLDMDVDLLEREMYAMKNSTEDFVEIPTWVRRLNSGLWHEGPRPSRRQAHLFEAFAIGCGVIFLAASFLVPNGFVVTAFRVAGFFSLVCGYVLSIVSRVIDTYKAWPETEIPWWQWRPERTLRGTVLDYAFVLLMLMLFFVVVFWLANAK